MIVILIVAAYVHIVYVDPCISFGSFVMCHYSQRDSIYYSLSENFQQILKDFNQYVTPTCIYSHDQVIDCTQKQQSLDLAWKASRELKEYKGFIEVLQFVLAMGNYLNDGSRQGGAYGFKLATLPKVCLPSI